MATLKNTTISDTGFLNVASGTNAQRTSTANGLVRYNSSLNALEKYANGAWQASGFPYRYYYEGIDANLFTSNWSNTTTTYMTQFGGFGPMYAHGYSASTTYTLTLTGIPTHNTIRYKVNWHFVDSADNESNSIILMNSSGTDTTFSQFRKASPTASSITIDSLATGATIVQSFQSRTYSYKPWGGSSVDGYFAFDSGYYAHTSSTFTAKHQIGLDQAIADEAVYFSHVEVWIGA